MNSTAPLLAALLGASVAAQADDLCALSNEAIWAWGAAECSVSLQQEDASVNHCTGDLEPVASDNAILRLSCPETGADIYVTVIRDTNPPAESEGDCSVLATGFTDRVQREVDIPGPYRWQYGRTGVQQRESTSVEHAAHMNFMDPRVVAEHARHLHEWHLNEVIWYPHYDHNGQNMWVRWYPGFAQQVITYLPTGHEFVYNIGIRCGRGNGFWYHGWGDEGAPGSYPSPCADYVPEDGDDPGVLEVPVTYGPSDGVNADRQAWMGAPPAGETTGAWLRTAGTYTVLVDGEPQAASISCVEVDPS